MSEATQVFTPDAADKSAERSSSTFSRVAKYTLFRSVALFFTIVVGVYLTILIANMGGHVDNIRRGTIREGVSIMVSMDPELRRLSSAERNQMINDLEWKNSAWASISRLSSAASASWATR
jgi:hypothetical protein